MNKDKISKLESISKAIISSFICEKLKDNDNVFGIITVTKVIITKDLSYSDIYISCFENKYNITKVLAKYAYNLQKELNKGLKIRKIPKIRFKYDESSEISFNLEEKIEKYCTMK